MDQDLVVHKKRHQNSSILTMLFLLLMSIGLANLYSAAPPGVFAAQLKHALVGFFFFIAIAWLIPLRFINTYAYVFYWMLVFFLIVVLILGHSAGGAQRWIHVGLPVRFQPSEVAKITTMMFVAKFVYNSRNRFYYTLRDLWPALGASFLVFALIFAQPDFATAGICLLIVACQLAFVRISVSYRLILFLLLLAVLGAVFGWFFLLRDYQKLRILTLINPELDISGSGYQALQSLVAVGSGGFLGKGFMQGTQTQLQFLPARHTDFIFSVFAEEHGFWGGVTVFVLFIAMTYMALEIARNAKDTFGSLIAIGAGAFLFIEYTINVAMVLGIFPVAGVPLPFFSYGGSSIITIFSAVALLVAVHRDTIRIS